MRHFQAFSAILLGSLLISGSASAVTVNLNNNHYDLHTVSVGQTGTIDNDNLSTNFLNIGTANDGAFGFLPAGTEITFTYVLTGTHVVNFNTTNDLVAFGAYDYHHAGNHYRGASYTNSGAGGDYAHGSINGSPSSALVLATSNITDGTHGSTTIINNSGSKAFFFSAFNVDCLHGDLLATYVVSAISAVPLPASLPLFAAALMLLVAASKKVRTRVPFTR